MTLKKESFAYYCLGLLILSAFMPFISKDLPITYEQLIIYLLFFCTSIISLITFKISRYGISFIFVILFLLMISSISIFLVNDYNFLQKRELYYVLSNTEKFTRIIAVISIVSYFLMNLDHDQIKKIKNRLIKVYIFLLSLNSLLIIFVYLDGSIPSFILEYYWQLNDGDIASTVAGRSYLNSRILGIFSQPMEAGCAYTIGVLLILYQGNFKFTYYFQKLPIITLLFIGGIFSISKTFYLGVILILLISLLRFKNFFLNLFLMFFLIFAVYIFYFSFDPFNEWGGWINFKNIYNMLSTFQISTIMNALTGGRFGTNESAQLLMYNQIMTNSPLFGFGLGSFAANEVPVDSGYMFIFYLSGLIGFITFVIFIFAFFYISMGKYLRSKLDDDLFILILVSYLIVVNIGAPIFILNRVMVILWIILMIFLIQQEKIKENL